MWTGAAGDGLFNTAANWQSNAVPSSGDTVSFPDLGSQQTLKISGTPSLSSISFAGNYTVSGGTIDLSNDLEAAANSSVVISSTLNLPGNNGFNDFTVDAGASLKIGDVTETTPQAQIQKVGEGDLILAGQGDAMLQAMEGTVTVDGSSEIDIEAMGATVDGAGTVGSLDSENTLTLSDSNGPSTITSLYNCDLSGTVNETIASGSSYGTLNNNYNGLSFYSAQLNATLANGYIPASGDVITLFHTSSGVSTYGTFEGLSEGATATISGVPFTISYVGGTSGHDVTLTPELLAPTVTLTPLSSYLPGATAALTATVAGSSTTPTGSVTFMDNGASLGTVNLVNGAATLNVSNLSVGTHPISAVYNGSTTYFATTSSASSATIAYSTPTVATHAAAAQTNARSFSLNVLGADVAGASHLTYTWSVTHVPSGARTPQFSANGTLSSQASTVRFYKDGTYDLRCTIANAGGNTVFSDVSVMVEQEATAVRITPHKASVGTSQTLQFGATPLDQFNHPMRTTAAALFSVAEGDASIDDSGLLTAGDTPGHLIIDVTVDDLTGTAGSTIIRS